MSKQIFKTEIKQLLNLMINSVYSNKEIFLRELISNSSDALDKLKYLTISDDKFKNLEFNPLINISFDEKKGTLRIEDNGIGMNENDLNDHLGTIAKSGTKSFLENLNKNDKKDSNLIGQFGVGFYSSFMVANKVVVNTRKAGEENSFTWISDGDGEYEILNSQKETYGTEITLFLKDEEKSFASRWKIEEIIKKYSNHIQFPIMLTYEEEIYEEKNEEQKADVANEAINETTNEKINNEKTNVEKEKKIEIKTIQTNTAKALWTIQKSELKKEDYIEFYKSLSYDKEEPYSYVHTHAEGGLLSYKSLFYLPSTPPFDMYRVDYQSNVKLYVKRIFITDNDTDLLPSYLRFVKGIIDSDDLPLNVSREILQQNKVLNEIKSSSVKKILSMIESLDKDKYENFFSKFGKVLKEGIHIDFENKERILNLILAYSFKKDKNINFKEYLESKKENQDFILYALGSNLETLKNNPILERFKDFDVLLFPDEVDSFVVPNIGEYKLGEKTFKFLDILSSEAQNKVSEDITDDVKEKFKALSETFKELPNVEDVHLSQTLSSPIALTNTSSSNAYMEQMMRQMGQTLPDPKKIVQININHELIKKINCLDSNLQSKYANVLFNGYKILEGDSLKDYKNYIESMNELLLNGLK